MIELHLLGEIESCHLSKHFQEFLEIGRQGVIQALRNILPLKTAMITAKPWKHVYTSENTWGTHFQSTDFSTSISYTPVRSSMHYSEKLLWVDTVCSVTEHSEGPSFPEFSDGNRLQQVKWPQNNNKFHFTALDFVKPFQQTRLQE